MLKQNLMNHSFHGQLETLNTKQFVIETVWVEAIEMMVLVTLIAFIFFTFGNIIWNKSKKEKSEAQKLQPSSNLSAIFQRQLFK